MKLIYLIVFMIAMVSVASGEIFYCENCTDCSEKIQNASNGDIVMLTSDISDYIGDCICFNGTDNVCFDGGGHTITGINRDDAGVYLSTYSQSCIVQNLTVNNFRQGIYLYESDYCHVRNVTAHDNSEGISLLYGLNNMIDHCDLYENRYYDFHFVPNLIDDCTNTVWNVNGSGGLPIGYYCGEVHLNDTEFSELCLCNADNSTFDNITIRGLSTLNNNGLRMYFTDNTSFTDIISTGNYNGIDMTDSNWNLFSNVDCTDVGGSGHGIHTYRCDNNTFDNITANYGRQTGIRLFHSDNNSIIAATVMNCYYHGIYITQSSNNTLNNSIITGMSVGKGLSIYKGENNLIYNNWFDNDVNIDVTSGYSNVWNVTNQTGQNIFGGSFIGGNYWSDYSGWHTRPDGFGDEPYEINVNNTDYLPLVITGEPDMWIRNGGYDLEVGEVWEYMVTCRDGSNMDVECENLTWISSNETVGILDGANFTALIIGTTNITVIDGELSDTIVQNVIGSSESNLVYFKPNSCIIPTVESKIIQIRMNTSNYINTWQTDISFDSDKINITDVNFTGAIFETYVGWENHGSYISIIGVDLVPSIGDQLLANITIECNCSNGCISSLDFIGEEGINRILAENTVNETGYPIIVVHNATWENGSVQCIEYIECGDVDGNGQVSANDVVETYGRSVNPDYPLVNEWAADVDSNGRITGNDVVEIYYTSIDPDHPLYCI